MRIYALICTLMALGMKLYRSGQQIFLEHGESWFELHDQDWDGLINRTQLHAFLNGLVTGLKPTSPPDDKTWQTPIGNQEVWAAGVTYLRSKEARMEEAKDAGGGDFYDRVYDAERPELFFKATAQRTVGPGEEVYIRRDSSWNVPEPELTLFCSAAGTIEGYTIGNDMSSRSIEGENPLYLPQAKSYSRSAALGPCLLVLAEPIPTSTVIEMTIRRQDQEVYRDQVSIDRMKRKHTELVEFLFRECAFPFGVFLMTGTCLVPDDDFTLAPGDQIFISIEHIGTLHNTVGINKN